MLGRKIQEGFDVGAWNGNVDLTRAVVTLSMIAGVALLWLSIAIFIKFQL
jgi:hypothetical protein